MNSILAVLLCVAIFIVTLFPIWACIRVSSREHEEIRKDSENEK